MNTAKGLEDLESAPNDELDGTILTVEDLGRTRRHNSPSYFQNLQLNHDRIHWPPFE